MSKYSVINLKVDPKLKKLVVKTADKLGVSVSAVLNNELRRFSVEQNVMFEIPEIPNSQTAKELAESKKPIDKGDLHKFADKKQALEFLARELK
jgi:antitoxin component of RelBE/YafQ-DinJ toxin-antitoxin module